MSWFKNAKLKLSWQYGTPLPPDLPPDLPVYEILNMATDMPYNIIQTDEVSVYLVPDVDFAKLVARSEYFDKPLAEHEVNLNDTLEKIRNDASAMARGATRMLIDIFA